MPAPAITVATLTPLATESYAATYRATLADGSGRALFVKRATQEELTCERMAVRAARLCGLGPHIVPPVGMAWVGGVTAGADPAPSLVMPWLDGLVPLSAHPHAARMLRDALPDERLRWRLLLWSFLIGVADRRQENYGILSATGALVAFDANFAFNARCAWYDTGKNALGELSGVGERDRDVLPPDVLRAVASVSGHVEREARVERGVRNVAALARRARVLRRLAARQERAVTRVTLADLRALCGECADASVTE